MLSYVVLRHCVLFSFGYSNNRIRNKIILEFMSLNTLNFLPCDIYYLVLGNFIFDNHPQQSISLFE